MERVSVLCLLLLLFCSLSGAELLDNEITEQRKASPESVNASEQPQPCPPDLLVLVDMSAKLAALQVRVDQLQILNQEQAAKLSEQAKILAELKTRDVDPIKEILKGQAAELNNIKSRANETEYHVDSLRRDRRAGQVAFSASLLSSGKGTLGPYNTYTTLVFRYVVSNIGNAYSPNTGFFTAPVRGAYHFEFYIYGVMRGSNGSGAKLVKNGEHIFGSWERQSDWGGTSANGATLLLEAGDVVFLHQWPNSVIDDDEDHHSTFSGRLLFHI